jgi:glutamate synthase (NADPH/NADH) small chain
MNQEANRCLLCKKARCTAACPVHTDVPRHMQQYRDGNFDDAAKMLFENNPFSAITCQVCDWHKLCFGHCILNARKVPVRWYEIENELSTAYLEKVHLQAGNGKGQKVAIVGGGPAGMTAAIKLREAGFSITIFDSNERLGGVLRYGIPQFRLDKKYVDQYERICSEMGIKFKGNTFVGKDITVASLRQDFDAVFIATGAILPRKLDIPGEDNPKVIYALDYLKNPKSYNLGKKVIVVGGGNVTMDASRTANRNGHETWVYYRKTFENMPANSIEVEEAKAEGVNFQVFEVPVEVKDETLVMRNCENVVSDDGKVHTRMIEGTDHEVAYDSLIIAISANIDHSIFGDEKPDFDEKGWLIVDNYNQTSIPGLFVAGDFLLGPQTVVEAVESAKKASEGIEKYLSGRN